MATSAGGAGPLLATRSGQGRLRLSDDRLERSRFADGEIGQHLAVDGHSRLAETIDETAVGQAERPHGGVEPLDPQRPERPLLPLAVPIGVLGGLFHRLFGDADRVLAPAVIALGSLEDLLVPGVRGDATFDAGHGRSPLCESCRSGWRRAAGAQPISAVRQKKFSDVVAVGLEHDPRAAVLADLLVGPLDHAMALARHRRQDLAGAGYLEALLGARFRLHLGHLALLCRPAAGTTPLPPNLCSNRAVMSIKPPPRQPFRPGSGEAALWQRRPALAMIARTLF